MTLTAADQQRIIQKESAWIDADRFAPLDLSGYPALQEAPAPERHDDRWSKDWRDTGLSASAAELRKFVSDPDSESLERVGNEIGHQGFRAEVRDRRGETIAEAFKRANPSYIPTAHNYELIAQTLSFNALSSSQQNGTLNEIVADLIDGGHWTVANLTACYQALDREGLLDVPVGSARNLSDSEALRVARLAQSGRADLAIGEYLKFALGGEEPDMAVVHDPHYRDVCDRAVMCVWECATADYSPTDERREFIQRYSAGRPMTLHLLDAAWAACQANEQRHDRSELLAPYQRPEGTPPPSQKQIDEMSDDAVTDLYHRSLRAYSDSVRRSPGMLA